jgi:FG-GAP-like repeat
MEKARRSQGSRGAVVWLAALTVMAVLSGPVSAAVAAAPADAGGTIQQAEDAASAQAVSSGQPVAVDAATQVDSALIAEPDGTFSQAFNDQPVRAQRNGAWVPLDSTLQESSDGTFSPAVSTNGLSLSGGGSGSLATLTNDGKTLSFTWPTMLPAPQVTGSSALYPDVLPDVDLKVTADDQGGFSEILIVKTAAAAADPTLAQLHLGTSVAGLSLATDAAGNLTATDPATGGTLFQAPTPLMWDSPAPAASAMHTTTVRQSAASADTGDSTDAPQPGSQQATVGVDLSSSGQLTLTPDSSLLTGSDTHYPVYIDPDVDPTPVSTTPDSSGSTYIQSAYPATKNYSDTSDNLGVGDQNYQTTTGVERAYYQFNMGAAAGTDISSAELNLTQSYSADFGCTKYTVTATNTAHISPSTTWDSQPTTYSETGTTPITGSGNSGCPGATKAGITVTQAAQDDGDGVLTFRLTDDESNPSAFKRFNKSASLDIIYNHPPNTPSSLETSPSPQPNTNTCTTNGGYGWIGSLSGGDIALSAHVSDPDGSKQNIQGKFSMWDDGGDGSGSTPTDYVYNESDSLSVSGSGGTVTFKVPASKLTDGHLYGWEVRAYDGIGTSDASDHCLFWYDATAPHNPTVTDTTPGSAGGNLTFSLSATDIVPSGARASGIDHYDYGLDSASALADDGGTHVDPSAAGSITVPVSAWGSHTLYAASVDQAGNESQPTTVRFYVPQGAATTHPGDVNDDGVPDLLATDSSNNSLDLIQPNQAVPGTSTAPAPAIASSPADSPDGTTWANTLIAHRSSSQYSATGNKVDDLWAEKNGHLWLYANNLNSESGLPGHNNEFYTADNRASVSRQLITCDTGSDCADFSTTNWTAVTQMIAPGDVNGDGNADLITVEGANLWLFLGSNTSGQFSDAIQLASGTNWTDYTIIAPGDTNSDGHADLWARNNSIGEIDQYLTTVDPSTGAITLSAPNKLDTTGNFSQSQRPLIASLGDLDGDTYPDLFTTVNTTNPTGVQLWANMGQALTGSTMFGSHNVVDDSDLWSHITDIN